MGWVMCRRWQILVFITEFAYMGLELLASRLLSPWFGSTLDIWTAILSVILVASACGNALSAKMTGFIEATGADDATQERSIAWYAMELLAVMAVSFAAVAPLAGLLGESLPARGIMMALLVATLCIFIPGAAIGAITPVAVEGHAKALGRGAGEASGNIYVAMTMGGLVGTVATGFWLLPALGATAMSHVMAILCLVTLIVSVAITPSLHDRESLGVTMVTLGLVVAGIVWGAIMSTGGASGPLLDVWEDTQYGRVHVYDQVVGKDGARYKAGDQIRFLRIDGGYESAMFVGDGARPEPVFDYVALCADTIEQATPDNAHVLFLGGGAYTMPKWIVERSQRQATVVEIDAGVTDIARRYFALGDAEATGRLVSVNADGRVYIDRCEERYDAVMNDTFAGDTPARLLCTEEAARSVKRILKEDGVYVVNCIGYAARDGESLLMDEVETLSQVFSHVHVLWNEPIGWNVRHNYVVVATDDDEWKVPDGMMEIGVTAGEQRVLTDDSAPVEYLVAREGME